ncbi:MAG: hypothetical protein HC831_06865 [Chloroflexia bacterium]|nr:hypothetical protein [Chloroflexia bacterium]
MLNDTYLWTGRRLLFFKAGNRIYLNEEGNVIGGALVDRTQLWTAKQRLFFKNNVQTYFNEKGYVIEGELSRDQEIDVRGKPILFLRSRQIVFDDEGRIMVGSIAKREHLLNTNDKTKGYKAESQLYFTEDSKVIEEEKRKKKRKEKLQTNKKQMILSILKPTITKPVLCSYHVYFKFKFNPKHFINRLLNSLC